MPDDALRPSTPRALLAALAAALLEEGHADVPERLGDVTLRPAQRRAAARLRAGIARHGGALLADGVGTGKTFTTLAAAAGYGAPVVVAPAMLRGQWARAAERALGRALPFMGIEALGRRAWREPAHWPACDLVIVDEAHHARNPRTRRWRRLAALCARAPVLLVTATPVHNREAELRALLALFLGDRARTADVQRHLVREADGTDGTDAAGGTAGAAAPRVEPLRHLPLPRGPDLLAALAALPPPVPPAGAGEAPALVAIGLLRAWASSEGALRAALVRRLTTGIALGDALRAGERPTAAALRRWIPGSGTVQLALPLDAAPAPVNPTDALHAAIEAHVTAIRALLARLDALPEHERVDRARARWLRRLLDATGRRVVAFAHSADTVRALHRRLRAVPGVASLTASGVRIAAGRLSRQALLAAFTPDAPPAPAHERVRLLLTTDLLSEGIELQRADTVVHLDRPWTPARLAQRVGRIARPGSPHAMVSVLAFAPPAPVRAALQLERRLRRKARAAATALGDRPLPLATTAPPRPDRAREPVHRVRSLLRRCAALGEPAAALPPDEPPLVAGVRSAHGGALALVRVDGSPRLIAVAPDGRIRDGPAAVARALARSLAAADAPAVYPAAAASNVEVARLRRRLHAWLATQRGRRLVGAGAGGAAAGAAGAAGAASAPLAALVRRGRAAVAAAPPARRAALHADVAELAALAARPLPAACEARLAALGASRPGEPPHAWLPRVAQAARALAGGCERPRPPDGPPPAVPDDIIGDRVLALLRLVPGGDLPTPPPRATPPG